MNLKSKLFHLSLVGCLSLIHLTANAIQFDGYGKSITGPTKPNLPSSIQNNSGLQNQTLTTAERKKIITNTPRQEINFKSLYYNLKSDTQEGTSKVEGGVAAGGGSIIIYPDTKTGEIKAKTIEVYQITEGPAQNEFTIDTGPGTTLQEKIDYVLNRLSKSSVAYAKKYRSWISDILHNPNETEDFSNLPLPRVKDTGIVSMPKGGILVQVFIQQFPGMLSFSNKKTEKRYFWNKQLFYSLDLDSQVALLLHEVIYRDYREVNKDKISNVTMNSERVQFATALILSKQVLNYRMKSELDDDPRADQSKSFYSLLAKLNLVSNSESDCRTDGCVTNKNDQFHAITEYLYNKSDYCVSNVTWIQSIKRIEDDKFEVICGDTYDKHKIILQTQTNTTDYSIQVNLIKIIKTK